MCDEAGAPDSFKQEIKQKELTTVTKRLRRVFSFSEQQLKEAVITNGANKIALNFANYIDWSMSGKNRVGDLTPKVRMFIERIENLTNVPVTLVGTGPRLHDVIILG